MKGERQRRYELSAEKSPGILRYLEVGKAPSQYSTLGPRLELFGKYAPSWWLAKSQDSSEPRMIMSCLLAPGTKQYVTKRRGTEY